MSDLSRRAGRLAIKQNSKLAVLERSNESWADLADDLRNLADKAYPELQDEARERLALNQYLQQLDQPQVAFGVKSKQPEKLDDAVSATLELETYVNMKPGGSAISCVLEEADGAIAAVHAHPDKLTIMMEKLMERMEKLEEQTRPAIVEMAGHARDRNPRRASWRPRLRSSQPLDQSQRTGLATSGQPGQFFGECWRCGERGHMARNCTRQPQGN